MKRSGIIFIILLFAFKMHSQEQEFENFKRDIKFYVAYTIGRYDSLPINPANNAKFIKRVDDTFKAFVLNKTSHEYEKLVTAKGDEKTRFVRLDGLGELYVTSFPVGSKTYIVYSYTSQPKKNYVIKDPETNKIVFEGTTNDYLIDAIYAIDPKHFLLIKKDGDFKTSRSAVVLLVTEKQVWKTTQSFSGKAFGQVPGDYFNKKFVKNRTYFQLECEMDFTLSKPADINKIGFDITTQTMSYKQYYENKKPVIITSRWENNMFSIDDYNVSENLRANDVAVPR